MANDRMWLVHKPSGKMALIAKNFGDGWYEYIGPRHLPYYSIEELLCTWGMDNNTDFVIEYESQPSES